MNRELRITLDELLQRGALKMLHGALEAESTNRSRGIARPGMNAGTQRSFGMAERRRARPVTGSRTLAVRAPRVK
jgi:hypothetical protein